MNELKTWEDLANLFNMVLFNNAVNIGNGEVFEEWYEKHDCQKENEDDNCECEVFQWYAIEISDTNANYLNKTYNLDIFYSDYLDLYILPVYHYGTAWDYVKLYKREEQGND